jgi:spermidine synthase
MNDEWITIDDDEVDDGTLRLMRRGESDFAIAWDHITLMTSESNLSELELGRVPCRRLADRMNPRVLLAGLGMGFTLRAALDVLPAGARVEVSELNEVVAYWCRGPLAVLTDHAVDDPRVTLSFGDVADRIRAAAEGSQGYDAIILDLYQGTFDANDDPHHPHYGRAALARTRRALAPGGIFAVWTEEADPGFERSLQRAGFEVESIRPELEGPRHMVYLATELPGPPPVGRDGAKAR